ncbi:MAG: nucleoside deaminase [Anaerolineales bacterium]|nr:nucleoside deaminase [Anaerolineales bacterium]
MHWNQLSLPWRTAVTEAWTAYCAGSLPIGAAIVDENGRLIATGRNSIHETDSSSPLNGSRLAHAEMNALIRLSKTAVSPKTCTLYTTLEPCMMCLGAIRMMRIQAVQFACPDPLAGSACLVETAPYQALGALPVHQADNQLLADVQWVLMVEAMLRTGRRPWLDFVETAVPHPNAAIELGKTVFASGDLWQFGQQQPSAEQMFSWLQDRLAP